MRSCLKKILIVFILSLWAIICFSLSSNNFVEAKAPKYEPNFTSHLKDYVLNPDNFWVDPEENFRTNVKNLFYPSVYGDNKIYKVVRDITLGVMIIFIVMAWASLLLNKKSDESKKHLTSLLYILLWCFYQVLD